MKYFQTHLRRELTTGNGFTYMAHCINYVKAKNKEEALADALSTGRSEDEIYVLEISKKTIKDQADHHLKCSAQWKKAMKDKSLHALNLRMAKVSYEATKNWAKVLMDLIK